MKNKIKLILAMIICFFTLLLVGGCNEEKIVSGTIKNGTLSTTLTKGSVLDTSNMTAVFVQKDGKLVEVDSKDLKIGSIDTTKVGNQILTITYKDFSFNVSIKIVASEADVNAIALLESQLLKEFYSNRGNQQNKQEEFFVKDEPLYVGDDNAFNFRINASGIDGSGNLINDIEKVRTNIVVEKNNNGSYEKLVGELLDSMVVIDTENTTLDFTENAIGNEFRVTVSAVNRDYAYEESATMFTANISVIDGYNVYTAKELSLYDNTSFGYNEIKNGLGVKGLQVNGIVLQGDISITKDDVRQDLFYTESHGNYATASNLTDQEVAGTPIDDPGNGVYYRRIKSGEEFNFIGNYFSVSLKDFPKMVVEGVNDLTKGVVANGDKEYITSHLCVFYTINEDEDTIKTDTLVNWKNLFFIGNGELNADPINSGSIILMKNYRVNFNAYNTITHNFYIGYFLALGDDSNDLNGHYLIDKCKGYNSYQCLFYVWGAKDLIVRSSEYLHSGGPAMIVDHVDPDSVGGNPSRVNIISSNISSEVTGKEPWFTVYGASQIVAQLVRFEELFDGTYASSGLIKTDKTIVSGTANDNGIQIPKLNLIVAMKSGDAQGLTSSRIKGYVRMFDSIDDFNVYYGINDSENKVTTYGLDMDKSQLVDKAMNSGYVYVESSGNGGYINQGFADNFDASITGTISAIGLNTILTQINSNFVVDKFNEMSLENKKDSLIARVGMLVNDAGLIALHSNAVNNNLIESIENFDILTTHEKQEEIISSIKQLQDTTYADGDYLNLYLNNGMGAIIKLYDRVV